MLYSTTSNFQGTNMNDILNSIIHGITTTGAFLIANVGTGTKLCAFIVVFLQIVYWINKIRNQ